MVSIERAILLLLYLLQAQALPTASTSSTAPDSTSTVTRPRQLSQADENAAAAASSYQPSYLEAASRFKHTLVQPNWASIAGYAKLISSLPHSAYTRYLPWHHHSNVASTTSNSLPSQPQRAYKPPTDDELRDQIISHWDGYIAKVQNDTLRDQLVELYEESKRKRLEDLDTAIAGREGRLPPPHIPTPEEQLKIESDFIEMVTKQWDDRIANALDQDTAARLQHQKERQLRKIADRKQPAKTEAKPKSTDLSASPSTDEDRILLPESLPEGSMATVSIYMYQISVIERKFESLQAATSSVHEYRLLEDRKKAAISAVQAELENYVAEQRTLESFGNLPFSPVKEKADGLEAEWVFVSGKTPSGPGLQSE